LSRLTKAKKWPIIFCMKRYCLLGLCLFLLGCAGLRSLSSEEALRQRIMAYWNHRIKGEFDKAYNYENPSFRKNVKLTDYIKALASGINWLEVKVKEVQIKDNQATVSLEIRYAFMAGYVPKGGLKREINDYWQWIKGDWYHLFRP